MRVSQFLSRTTRQDPSEAETTSHRLMLKAGMMAQIAAGVYAYLPLAVRSLDKIGRIIREELDAIGAQEVRLPALQSIDTWRTSHRDTAFGPALFRLTDRREREMVLAPTHEEVITMVVRASVSSYRDLPLLVYQVQTKFRDELRPRAGLLRGREFDMMDAYSFDTGWEGLNQSYLGVMEAYEAIFRRCGLITMAVEADSGAIGGKDSHEFIMPSSTGEDVVFHCPTGDYAANAERASSRIIPLQSADPLPLKSIATPGATTIQDVTALLGVSPAQTLKTIVYRAAGGTIDATIVLVAIRGDLDVNEVKLKNVLGAAELRLATRPESEAAGLTVGYVSLIGVESVMRIADDSVRHGGNFVVGGNRLGYHYLNVNYPRDFTADKVVDIAQAADGHGCPECGAPLESIRGVEVGHVFKLGDFFSTAFDANFLDRDGTQHPIIMGCYGIGVTRMLAAAIEQNHDTKGIVFPLSIAPFEMHLVALNIDNPQVRNAAEMAYKELRSKGHEVLYDDRDETAGVKFNDADLLGLPLRIIVSPRSIAKESVEITNRRTSESTQVPLVALNETVRKWLLPE